MTARGMAAVRTMCAIKRQSRFISDWRRLSGGDTMLTTLAWVYTVGFVGVFLITHAPGFTDADGFLFGLFKIDPIDDVVHCSPASSARSSPCGPGTGFARTSCGWASSTDSTP